MFGRWGARGRPPSWRLSAQLRIGKQRLNIDAGQSTSLTLSPGDHVISLRNHDGTVIWAQRTLHVGAQEGLVVQLSDGRMPELFGAGRFHPSGG